MKTQDKSPIIEAAGRELTPLIQLVGLYVFFHGHYGPGGGFQGGVLMAASILLLRMSLGSELSQYQIATRTTVTLCAIGVLIYAGTGLAAMLSGGNFLDYAFLPIPGMHGAELRYYGIMFIEAGVILAVMTALVSIYDDLLGA